MGEDHQLRLLDAIARAVGVTPGVSVVPQVTICALFKLYISSPEFVGLSDPGTELGRIKRIESVIGDRNAVTLTLSDVDHYRTVRREAGIKPATRNREVVRLGKALRWAAERGHIPGYPLPRMKQEPERNERSTYRTEEDVLAIVAAAKAKGRPVIAAIIATAYDSGLRRREVCRLRLDQLDNKAGVISIAALDTKAQRARATVLSDWATDLINAIERPPGSPWAFPTKRGKPYNKRSVTRYYQEACELAGIEAAPGERNYFHDTRAGFADKQVEIGTPDQHLMVMAGWQDHRTMRRYLRRKAHKIAMDAKARLEEHRRSPQRAKIVTNEKLASEKTLTK